MSSPALPATHAAEGSHLSTASGEHFHPDELRQFDADDTEAGTAIGRMLSMFFFYTVIVMGLSTYVTYYWISLRK